MTIDLEAIRARDELSHCRDVCVACDDVHNAVRRDRRALLAAYDALAARAAILDQYGDCGHGMIYQFGGAPCLACSRDALAAENALLREERDRAVNQVAAYAAENAALRQRNEELRQANGWAELEAERDALRKDAERYHRVMRVIRALCAAKTPELLADLDAAMGEKP